jgi:hypothetical protein
MTDDVNAVPAVETVRRARAPQLDAAAAEALALVTLLTTGAPSDVDRASCLVEESLGAPDGAQRLVNGLSSVCAALLVLLEFHGTLAVDDALHEVGRLIAQASLPA